MKDINYYLALDYPINLCPISVEDGGGWLAEISILKGCMSDGETKEQALISLQNAKETWLKTALKRGQNIPTPSSDDSNEYSGKFTMRIPRTLHRELTLAAKEENISLNQYLLSLVSYNFGSRDAEKKSVSVYNHNTIIIPEEKPTKNYRQLADLDQIRELWETPLKPMEGARRW